MTDIGVALIGFAGLVVVGVLTLIGTVINARRSGQVKNAINGELHDRLDSIDASLATIVNEMAKEKVRAQFAEAEASARLDRLEHP